MKLLSSLLIFLSSLASASEFRERIVLIDTGLDSMNHIELCSDGHKDFSGTGLEDRLDHGTEVFRIATRNLNISKYCITVIKWTDSQQETSISGMQYSRLMSYVYNLHPGFVNISSSGKGYLKAEEMYLQNMASEGVKIFVAAGNDSRDLTLNCDVFPACYNITDNFFVLGAEDESGNKLSSSNFGGPVSFSLGVFHRYGKTYQGSSFAAPFRLNKELR